MRGLTPAARFGPPFIVVLAILVGLAIQFNNQLVFGAAEVRDVLIDRELPAELEAAELAVSQAGLELSFGRDGLVTHLSGPGQQFG